MEPRISFAEDANEMFRFCGRIRQLGIEAI